MIKPQIRVGHYVIRPYSDIAINYSTSSVQVCDVISRWETALREKGSGKFENKRVIRFTYKNRMFWRRSTPGETEKERLLFCYQISRQIVEGRFPLNKELAFELSALMAQVPLSFR